LLVIIIGDQERSMTESEFREAFEQHKDAVYRFAWRMTNSPAAAEDIAQDTFLLLLRRPERFDSRRGEIRSFLLGVARNLALKRWRDEKRWNELDDEQFIVHPEDLVSRETSEIVGAAVQALPPLQREVLVLAQYEGLTLGEIANVVGTEVGTVKSRLHRARENLKRMLATLKKPDGRILHNGTAK
jgi:RNA polymerase sigma-70 factor, ECF subfamily